MNTNPIDPTGTSHRAKPRRIWCAPSYSKMRAGDAENGPNPDAKDVDFAKS